MLLQLSKTVKQSPKSPQIFENNGTFCADRPFSKNRSETNCQKSFVFNQLVSELQSYILSTTTETRGEGKREDISVRLQSYILSTTTETFWHWILCFYPCRLQSYILSTTTETPEATGWRSLLLASIVHPFNNNWNQSNLSAFGVLGGFNRTSFQQQLKRRRSTFNPYGYSASIVHPFNNNWNRYYIVIYRFLSRFNRTSFQQQLKPKQTKKVPAEI